MWDERAHPRPVAAGRGSWGQPDPGDAGKGGSSPDNDGRSQHHQRLRSGKQDGKVYECRNQRSNPLKNDTGSNLVDMGRACSEGAPDSSDGRASRHPKRVDEGSFGESLRRTRGRLQGKSWAPPPTNGCVVNLGTAMKLPRPVWAGKERRPLTASGRGGAPVVVRGWESQPHGEGGQQVRSVGVGMPGGRQ